MNAENSEVNIAHRLFAEVKAADRFVTKLDSTYVIDFPVGIIANDSKEAEKYAIIVSEMKLRNGETFLTAYMAFTVPGTTKKIAFKGTDIPFSFSGGIKGSATLELVSDFDIELTNNINLILKGAGNTKVKWDCFGFQEMDIMADVLFDSTLFIPENPDGSLKQSALRTSFQTIITDWNNLMVGITLEPFQMKGLTGVGFSITNAVFDLSDFRNPANIAFTPQYQTDYFIDGNPNIWQGLYIQDAQICLPQQFRKKTASELQADSLLIVNETTETLVADSVSIGRLTFYAQNLFIDELGFTGRLAASHLMTLDEGDLGGWAFSVENFAIDIQSNQLVAGGFSGQINVPQFKQNSLFNYNAVMGLDNIYSFNVAITEFIEMGMWAADLSIEPNSALNIEVKEKLIYSMQFKSSNYNTFTQKINGLTYSDGITWGLYPLVHSLTVNISGERFDNYEVVNLNTATMVTVSPVLSETPWYTSYMQPLFNLSAANMAAIGIEPFKPDELTNYLFQSDGTRRLTKDEINMRSVSEVSVISGMKHYIAKYSCEYLYYLKGKIANAYVNKKISSGQLENIYNTNFTPLRYGNYPVNINYTLPGKTTPQRVKKHIIRYND